MAAIDNAQTVQTGAERDESERRIISGMTVEPKFEVVRRMISDACDTLRHATAERLAAHASGEFPNDSPGMQRACDMSADLCDLS
jgi:hypothetical protein